MTPDQKKNVLAGIDEIERHDQLCQTLDDCGVIIIHSDGAALDRKLEEHLGEETYNELRQHLLKAAREFLREIREEAVHGIKLSLSHEWGASPTPPVEDCGSTRATSREEARATALRVKSTL